MSMSIFLHMWLQRWQCLKMWFMFKYKRGIVMATGEKDELGITHRHMDKHPHTHTHRHSTCVQLMIDAATTHSAWSAFCPPQGHSRRRRRWPCRRAGQPRSCRSWRRAGRGRTQSRCWWAARQCPSAGVPSPPSSPRVRCRSSTAPRPRSWQLPRAHRLPGTWRMATPRLRESSETDENRKRYKNTDKKKSGGVMFSWLKERQKYPHWLWKAEANT